MASSDPKLNSQRELPERLTALSHRAPLFGDDGLSMQEAPHLGKLILRIDPTLLGAKAQKVLQGADLPIEACTSSLSDTGSLSILWLGPDEWMIVSEANAQVALQSRMETALKAQHFQLSNVTDYYCCIEISGHQTREILMNLTTLDMDARTFSVGDVKGTLFGHANAFVWQVQDETGAAEKFRLIVRSSMADYLWCLISRSARLFGLPEDSPLSGERLVI